MSHLDLLQFHAFCVAETGSRLEQYSRAIGAAVRAGDVVLDLGTGSGLLAVLACQAGARRVYGVEPSEAIRLGELIASTAGCAHRIEFLQSMSTEVTLHERADVLVADIHDTFGLQAGGLGAFLDARDRLLRPGGRLIPRAIELLAAPVEAPAFYDREVDVWARHVQKIDVSPVRPFAVNQVHAGRFEPQQLLARPVRVGSLDLSTRVTRHVACAAATAIERDGFMHGLCGCFVSALASDICLGNVPGDTGTTNFAQAFFPIERPVAVGAGDDVFMGIDSHDGHVFRWRVEIARAGRPPHARFEHSTLAGLLLSPTSLRRSSSP